MSECIDCGKDLHHRAVKCGCGRAVEQPKISKATKIADYSPQCEFNGLSGQCRYAGVSEFGAPSEERSYCHLHYNYHVHRSRPPSLDKGYCEWVVDSSITGAKQVDYTCSLIDYYIHKSKQEVCAL